MKAEKLYKILSDETRLRILSLLYRAGQLCVCEIVAILKTSQPKLSRHLSLLRLSKVVSDERKGQWIYYKINDEFSHKELLDMNLGSLIKKEPFCSDFLALKSEAISCVPKNSLAK